ncbi:MAG: hypothetical protein M3389_10105, partial [Actinomycetota bacterium]|nr:hypothetical protein [Actinomycetota bacterium]
MNDLEQLREDVRATAPQPRPEFAARLERRVEAGFRPATPVRRERRINLWGPSIALGCIALVAVAIAFGSASTTGDDAEEGGGDAA